MESQPYGWIAATTNVAGQVTVQQTLTFGRQRFLGLLGAFTGFLNTANLSYDVTAMRLFARILLSFGLWQMGLTLVDVAAPARFLAPFLP